MATFSDAIMIYSFYISFLAVFPREQLPTELLPRLFIGSALRRLSLLDNFPRGFFSSILSFKVNDWQLNCAYVKERILFWGKRASVHLITRRNCTGKTVYTHWNCVFTILKSNASLHNARVPLNNTRSNWYLYLFQQCKLGSSCIKFTSLVWETMIFLRAKNFLPYLGGNGTSSLVLRGSVSDTSHTTLDITSQDSRRIASETFILHGSIKKKKKTNIE